MGRGPAWTGAEDKRLVALMEEGLAPTVIAERLKRTICAVHKRCSDLRASGIRVAYARPGLRTAKPAPPPIVLAPRQQRPCLGGCGRLIVRDGITFMCPHCRNRATNVSPFAPAL